MVLVLPAQVQDWTQQQGQLRHFLVSQRLVAVLAGVEAVGLMVLVVPVEVAGLRYQPLEVPPRLVKATTAVTAAQVVVALVVAAVALAWLVVTVVFLPTAARVVTAQ